MDIGGALSQARSEAGLTVTEVSQRTRIREALIRDIERDDYSACGGDYYARGHIRAIARAVGADPVPLIEEYDAARLPPEPDGLEDTAGHTDGRGWRAPAWNRRQDDVFNGTGNGAVTSPVNGHGAVNGAGTPGSRTAVRGVTAAEAFRPSLPLQMRRRRRPRWAASLVVILLAVIGALTYLLIAGGTSHGSTGASAQEHGGRARSPRPTASPSRTTAAAPAPVPLTVASAAAFGPGGTSQGDNPLLAQFAIDGSATTDWLTDWYATPTFDGLQPGTGLLLDMGSQVTVTSAQILLGPAAGGDIELLAGNRPVLSDLQVVAHAANSGGQLTVQVSAPVAARYLVVWFTSLPPDGWGTYQAEIYNVTVSGTQ